MRILFFLLFPIFLSAQINRAYGVIEIGTTFPSSSTTGPKFAYRPADSSFYRWVSGSTWVKVVESSITQDTLFLTDELGTTVKVSGDTINLTPYLLKSDTTSMLVRYIERGDTASMLTNYPSTAGYGIIDGGKTWRADTTAPSGLATRVYARTLPTLIGSGQVAYSNGSTLVGSSLFTFSATRPTLSMGLTASTSTSTPTLIDMGGTYSSVAGANPKLNLFSAAGNSYGFGISANSLDYITTSPGAHSFYSSGTLLGKILSTGQFGIGNNATPSYILDITSTDAIRLPRGTDAQRPTNAFGLLRGNTTGNGIEFGNGTTWDYLLRTSLTGGLGTADRVGVFDSNGKLTGYGEMTFNTTNGLYINSASIAYPAAPLRIAGTATTSTGLNIILSGLEITTTLNSTVGNNVRTGIYVNPTFTGTAANYSGIRVASKSQYTGFGNAALVLPISTSNGIHIEGTGTGITIGMNSAASYGISGVANVDNFYRHLVAARSTTTVGVSTGLSLAAIPSGVSDSQVNVGLGAELAVNNGGASFNDFVLRTTSSNATTERLRVKGQNGFFGIGTTPSYFLDLNSTDAIRLPRGTTAQRPTLSNSLIRYNSDLDAYDVGRNGGATWDQLGMLGKTQTWTGTNTFQANGVSGAIYWQTLNSNIGTPIQLRSQINTPYSATFHGLAYSNNSGIMFDHTNNGFLTMYANGEISMYAALGSSGGQNIRLNAYGQSVNNNGWNNLLSATTITNPGINSGNIRNTRIAPTFNVTHANTMVLTGLYYNPTISSFSPGTHYVVDSEMGDMFLKNAAGTKLMMYSNVNNTGSPEIQLGNAVNAAKAGIIRGTAVGANSEVNLDFITNNTTYFRISPTTGSILPNTRFYKPVVVHDTLSISGLTNNTGNKFLFFNATGNQGYKGNAAIIAVPTGANSNISGFGLAINNTGAGTWANASTSDFALYVNNNKKIGLQNNNPQRDLHVTGEVRVTDLITDPPTQIVGADADGDLGVLALAGGLSITSGTLRGADSLKHWSNVLFVSPNGNDGTAVKNKLTRPWLTPDAAKTAATSGDLIVVLTGTYSATNLWKPGVDWHFENVTINNNITSEYVLNSAIYKATSSGSMRITGNLTTGQLLQVDTAGVNVYAEGHQLGQIWIGSGAMSCNLHFEAKVGNSQIFIAATSSDSIKDNSIYYHTKFVNQGDAVGIRHNLTNTTPTRNNVTWQADIVDYGNTTIFFTDRGMIAGQGLGAVFSRSRLNMKIGKGVFNSSSNEQLIALPMYTTTTTSRNEINLHCDDCEFRGNSTLARELRLAGIELTKISGKYTTYSTLYPLVQNSSDHSNTNRVIFSGEFIGVDTSLFVLGVPMNWQFEGNYITKESDDVVISTSSGNGSTKPILKNFYVNSPATTPIQSTTVTTWYTAGAWDYGTINQDSDITFTRENEYGASAGAAKRDTTIYVTDADYDFTTATEADATIVTTEEISRRYNRVIFLMTTTAGAGSDSELTLHTPDANLMQVEYLIRSTDETGGFTNVIKFGTNNAVASDNALASTYTPSPGQGVGIRAGLRSGVYKYFYY